MKIVEIKLKGFSLFRVRLQNQLKNLEKTGAGNRTRTDDLLITNQLLYQLSYPGKAYILSEIPEIFPYRH